jgi:glutamate dehydrogenase
VCSPQFSGIHLRSTKVSRGGIRWSDRREDFRTEILGLMKAQRVKNAVIVPSGAKGGFVLHEASSFVDKSVFEDEVVSCYKQFISGLLDITDNIVNDEFVHPKDIICYDDFDPYFVVAADKGTGSFSDIANQLSKEYQFWLGDAFASGGSEGYNHKTMGITARGAWESIKRHFIGLNINIKKDDFTVVGIGDMSGDVFGNGLIYSNHIRLVAAFDHRDIFIDPQPDAARSFVERVRLFNLPRSSWQDYNKEFISKGGGVFSRKAKTIELSDEIRKCLSIEDHSIVPDDLVKAILKAPVDLLYNGGIGTYIKATSENHVEVGDRTNDECRINGSEVRARVIGEGGNLGVTQLGRIEFAMRGGNIFTDFIDNSGGVDCSDHEVNIKILLSQVIADGKLNEADRHIILHEMCDEVASLVLNDNYQQAQALALSASHDSHFSGIYQHYLKELETKGDLNRAIEFLPDDKAILDRKTAEQPVTEPELAVLLEYSKIYIKNEILASHLPEEKHLAMLVECAFPSLIKNKYPAYMAKHRLHREIIATQLSNKVVNEMGMTFVHREKIETGASIPEVICAYVISADVFQSDELRKIIDDLDFNVPAKLQYELLHHIRHLLNLSTRWFLRSHYLTKDIAKTIKHFAVPIKKLIPMLPDLMSGTTKKYLEALTDQFASAGIPRKTAERIASYRAIYIFLNVVEVATTNHFDLTKTAEMYFHVGTRFNLVWFRDQISSDAREGHWNAMARLRLRDELDTLQKSLTVAIMLAYKNETDVNRMIDHWSEKHPRPVVRWNEMLQLLHATDNIDYTMFFIALGELSDWVRVDEVVASDH